MNSSSKNNSPLGAGGIIDAHQHFWNYDPISHAWINDDMQVIRQNFHPKDLQPVLHSNGVNGCVAVQADQTEAETDFLIELVKENNFIKGVVGWVDLRADNLHERLAHYQQTKIVKGFRHILQGEEPAFMLQESFKRGIGGLADFGFTYDLLVYPKHLSAALELVQAFPNQRFVIDHIAKPFIKDGLIDEWKTLIHSFTHSPNVSCKVSGIVTEADWKNWKSTDFTPYLDVITETFGSKRIMYGSDWPVCLVAASYERMYGLVKDYYAGFSKDEQADIFGNNAKEFYNLNT